MKINKSELFKKAWTLAKESAAKFECPAKDFFSESLKQAWTAAKLEDNGLLGRIKCHPAVGGFSEWKKHEHDRIYFNIKGYDKSFKGCRNFKLYFDNKTQQLIMIEKKGMQPDEFRTATMGIYEDFENDLNFKYIQ